MQTPTPDPATRVDLPAPDRAEAEAIKLVRDTRDDLGRARLVCECGAAGVTVDLDAIRFALNATIERVVELIEHARNAHETPADILAEVRPMVTMRKGGKR